VIYLLYAVAAIVVGAVVGAIIMLLRGGKAASNSNVPLEADVLAFASTYSVADAAKRFDLSLKTVKRLRVFANQEPKSCASCAHFDLAEGQKSINSHGVMARVTNALTPNQLSKGETILRQNWSEFGVCLARPGLGIGSSDWCGKWPDAAEKGGDLWA
jgi:hypothetical protein